MSFADNLQEVRKNSNITIEELAEALNVSTQDVYKWELGESYPDYETLIQISKLFNISLDALAVNDESNQKEVGEENKDSIIIRSPYEGIEISCYKVTSLHLQKAAKDEPKYALFGVTGGSILGEKTTLLGWYENQEDIMAEIGEITSAMMIGIRLYELKYSVKTLRSLTKIIIVK